MAILLKEATSKLPKIDREGHVTDRDEGAAGGVSLAGRDIDIIAEAEGPIDRGLVDEGEEEELPIDDRGGDAGGQTIQTLMSRRLLNIGKLSLGWEDVILLLVLTVVIVSWIRGEMGYQDVLLTLMGTGAGSVWGFASASQQAKQ